MNTNRISTDIKHAKEALEKKLDSLQLGVDGIPNLLTPSFDSIKNVLSTITTKVEGVKTDVAGVGSKVDAVKSDVAKTAKSTEISALENKLTNEIKKSYLDLSKAQYKELESKFNSKIDVISVEGAGEVYLIAIDSKQSTVQVQVEVDGITACFIVSTNRDAGFVYEGIIKSTYKDTLLTHAFGYCFIENADIRNYDLYKISSKLSDNYQVNTRFLIKKEPLKFNKSFKISVVEPLTSYNSETFDCKIAYSLS